MGSLGAGRVVAPQLKLNPSNNTPIAVVFARIRLHKKRGCKNIPPQITRIRNVSTCLLGCNVAATPWIGHTDPLAALKIQGNRIGVTLLAIAIDDRVSFGAQCRSYRVRHGGFHEDYIGHPLMVNTWRIDGRNGIHIESGEVQDHLQHRVDN
jgi:hypothetical protein